MVALAGSVNGLGGLHPPNGKAIRFWTMAPAGRDNAIGTEAERVMAKHIGAHTVEAKHASHAVLVSQPGTTTRLILDAARATD